MPHSYEPVYLDESIKHKHRDAAKEVSKNPSAKSKYSKYSNSDKDKLYDFEEILFYWGNSEIETMTFPVKTSNMPESEILAELPTLSEVCDTIRELVWDKKNSDNYHEYSYILKVSEFINQDIYPNVRILPIKSNPNSEDSEGDGHLDHDDPRPLRWDPHSVALKNVNYIRILDITNGTPSYKYGGIQAWFEHYIYYDEGEWMNDTGCGLVAICDMLIYLQQNHNMSNLTPLSINIHSKSYVDFAESLDLYKEYTGHSAAYDRNIGGMKHGKITDFLESYFNDNGYNISCNYTSIKNNDSNNRDMVLKEMCRMLDNDIPVMLRFGFKNKIKYYDTNSNYIDIVDWHYVNVTGMDVDIVNDKIILTFSSWGVEYTMNFDEYYKNTNSTGGIFSVEIK
jgi:hypothetical protein